MEINLNPTLAWFLLAIFVIGIGLCTSLYASRIINRFLSQLKNLAEVQSKEITLMIEHGLATSVRFFDGEDAVMSRAADIILEVAKEELPENRFISFYGGSSLSYRIADIDSLDHIGDDFDTEIQPSERYLSAMRIAARKQVRMRRYIRLLTLDEIRERSSSTQRQYLMWLENQLSTLEENSAYQLVDAIKAPQWGTNTARIITRSHIMDIIGNGLSALVITDDIIAKRVSNLARSSVLDESSEVSNPPIYYGIASETHPIEKFKDMVKIIHNVIEKK